MDLDLSEDQKMLRTAARDFLEKECTKQHVRDMEQDENGYSPELWSKMVQLGWMGLPFPESYGGGGWGFLDLVLLLEEMGRVCLPGPFLPTVVLSGLPILAAGSEEQKQELLPQVCQGKIFTLALTEPEGSYEAASIQTTATTDGGDYVISGTKLFVPDAHVADWLLCVARTSEGGSDSKGLSVFLVDARTEGMACTVLPTIASDKQCEVVFDRVRVPARNVIGGVDQGWPVVQKALQWAAVAKCAEMVGAGEYVLEISAAYARERVQFDRPIGSFQAIQHHCANMRIDVDAMRYLTYEAAWLLTEGLPADREVSMAKAWVSEAIGRVTRLGHQIHGGVGYIMDHDMQLYFRRGEAAKALFGNAVFHRELIACQLGL
ncbi:MAG: acyl-CoA dehydrogenase [Chloroflexi bacterium]|nr:MAG: acyl-CoA dehydrogenase [Chloroflexota bacterium]